MEKQSFLSLGLMSGTSMDGIDAALIETDGSPHCIREIGQCSLAYSSSFRTLLKGAEYAIRKRAEEEIARHAPDAATILKNAGESFLEDLQDYLRQDLKLEGEEARLKLRDLSFCLSRDKKPFPLALDAIIARSTDLHAQVAKELLEKTGKKPQDIDVVGCHGQAFFHRPSAGVSIVLNDGAKLARQMGITVVNDFRSNDIAAGGQGAPFAPLYHQALALRDGKIPCAVVNCGGIANITLAFSGQAADLQAFDAGPGNGLIDQFVRQRTRGHENMDRDGNYGCKGRVHDDALALLYEKSLVKDGINYFSKLPPKSLDIGDMNLIPELDSLSLEDGCATLEAFTADAIVQSLDFMKTPWAIPRQWILAGGGWRNRVIRKEFEKRLRERLRRRSLEEAKIYLADDIGWRSQALEAQIFAYLAVRSLHNMPLSGRGTTGVSRPISGGVIFAPPTGATRKVQELLHKRFPA